MLFYLSAHFLPFLRAVRRLPKVVLAIGALVFPLESFAQAPWGGPLLQRGIAAVSCGAASVDVSGTTLPASDMYTFGLVDLRTPVASDYAGCGTGVPLWNAPMYHHPSWNAQDLGNVFGITLDDEGNMYAAAHGLYGTYKPLHHRYGDIGGGATDLAAAGTVYRIDGMTGMVSVFAVIPGQQTMTINSSFSSGPGLGNIAYDRVHDQFFVSSMEDGKIYRVDGTGTVVDSFDPLAPDSGAPGLPPRHERVWAVEVSEGAVYYSITNDGTTLNPGEIRRVNLDGSGGFNVSSDALVINVPGQNAVYNGGTPATDISFSLDGNKMLVGTRTMQTDTTAYNHRSSTHLLERSGGVWTVSGTDSTGCNDQNGEAYGGVAFGEENGLQEQIAWTSSADMASGVGPHGLYGIRLADFPASGQAPASFKVPYDPAFANLPAEDRKGSGGDIEILRERPECMEIEAGEIACPEAPDEPYTVELEITNNSGQTALYAWLTPAPSPPLGGSAIQPEPSGILTLPAPLPSGASTNLSIELPADTAGGTVCFRVTLFTREGDECCTETICVDIPSCECAEVLGSEVACEVLDDGTIQYTLFLEVRNLTHLSANPTGFAYATFLPPNGFSPAFAQPSPNPIPPGGTGLVEATFLGTPGTLCFQLGLHDEALEECCSLRLCIDLPECPPATGEPDECRVETRVACEPREGDGPGVATLNYTVFNNANVPRTYNWSISGTANPGCSNTLSPGNFIPSSGTLGPIPPGGSMSTPIEVICEGFEPGDCAGFAITASYNDEVEPLLCEGVVFRPRLDGPRIRADIGDDLVIPDEETVPIAFSVENPTETPVKAVIRLRDSAGILGFSDGRGEFSPYVFLNEELKAGESRRVVVDVRRFDGGSAAPGWTLIEVAAGEEEGPAPGAPLLTLPALLPPTEDSGEFAVRRIVVEDREAMSFVLTVPTVTGRKYRIEEASHPAGPWSPADSTTTDSIMDEEGYIRGANRDVDCRVLCEPSERRIFFRAVEYR